MLGQKIFCLLIIATAFVFGVPAFAQDKQSIEKNLPKLFEGKLGKGVLLSRFHMQRTNTI